MAERRDPMTIDIHRIVMRKDAWRLFAALVVAIFGQPGWLNGSGEA